LGRCLYCGGERLVPHYEQVRDRLGFVSGEWKFNRCRDCQSLRLDPFPHADDIAGFYPPVYSFSLDAGRESWLRRLLVQLEYRCFYRPQYRAQARQVLRGIGWQGERGLRLLDVGCGRGLRLTAFRDRGFHVQGVDLQPEVVEYVRRELAIDAAVGGIDSLDTLFQPESFDLITAFYLLEHVPDVYQVLDRCRRLLRPGGWLVGVVPICDGLQARLFGSRWIHVREAPRHLSLPAARGLMRVAERAGYGDVTIRPDALLNCAGIVGGSLLPGSDLTATYGGGPGRWWALVKRLLGGGLTVGAIPLCLLENHILRQTSHGMLFARRPS
jgi:SAM-dependent methyltransferase